eukprot:10659430-Prorocentrum_lima.AAC.1
MLIEYISIGLRDGEGSGTGDAGAAPAYDGLGVVEAVINPSSTAVARAAEDPTPMDVDNGPRERSRSRNADHE